MPLVSVFDYFSKILSAVSEFCEDLRECPELKRDTNLERIFSLIKNCVEIISALF